MMLPPRYLPRRTVLFCPNCGHSLSGGRSTAKLADGSFRCGQSLHEIPLEQWQELVGSTRAILTPDGRELMGALAPQGEGA